MPQPLVLENQTLVRGLRRDAVGDERFSSFHTLENYDVVYDPTVSLRRRKRFIKHSLLTNDTSTSPVDWLYVTHLNNRYVIFSVREDGKITRSVLNTTEQTYSFLPKAGVVDLDDVILFSQVDFDTVNLNDALLYTMPSGGTSLSGLADKNTYIVQALGTIDNALGIRLAATPLSTTYLNLTQHASEGNLHTLTTAPYYSEVHDLNVATSANLWKESAYYNDIRVRFLTIGKRVFIQTYAGDESLNKEHGLYFITENMTAAAPVNLEYSGDELIDIHGIGIYVNGKAENTSVTDDRADGFHSVIKSFDYTPDEIEFDGAAKSTASNRLEGMHQIHIGTPLFIHRVGESDSNLESKVRELSTVDPEAYRLTLGMDMDANRAVSSNTSPVGWVSQRFSIEWMGINAGDGTDIASANTVDSWEPNPDFPAAYIFDKVMIAMTVNDVNTATDVGQNATATDPYDDVFKKEKVPGNFKLYITKDKLDTATGHIGQGIPDWDNVIAESPWMSSNNLGQCTIALGGPDGDDLLHSSKVDSVVGNNQDALTNVAGDVAAPQSIRATAQDEENGMWHISSWVDNTDEIGTGALYLEGMDSTAPDLNTGRVQYYNLVITADKDYFEFVRHANNFDPPAIDNSQTKRDQKSLKKGVQIWCERSDVWKGTQAKVAKESINEDGLGLVKPNLTGPQKQRNLVKIAPYLSANHPNTKPTDAAWVVSDNGNVEGINDNHPADGGAGNGLVMGFMVGQPEWWVSNSTIYSRFRNYTTGTFPVDATVYDGNHDNLNYGISYANPDIPHETELPLITEALSAPTSSRPIQAWTADHGPGHQGSNTLIYQYPKYTGNDIERNIVNLKPDHKTGNFPDTSLGFDFTSHYRIYRQRTQADASWEWVQDIPISLGRNRSIAVVLSHIWQGLSDPKIYLPNDEDDKAYAPEHMGVWAERLWLAVENKLRFSARAEESTRYGVTGTPIYESIPISNMIEFDENITALSVFGDRLVVFFKNHTRILSGALSMLNPPPDLVVSDIMTDEGTIRPDSVTPFRGSVSFINQFGQVRMFSGQEVTSDISDPNQSIWNSFGANRIVFSTVYDDQLIIGVDTTTVPDKRAEELHILDLRKMQLPIWKVYKLTSSLTNLQVRHDNRLIGAIDGSSWIKGLIELDGYSNTEFSAALSGSTSSAPIKIQPINVGGNAEFTYVRPYAEIYRPVVGDAVVVERSDTIGYNGTRYIHSISVSSSVATDDTVLLSTNPNDLNGSILPYDGLQGYDFGRIAFTHATIEPELTSKVSTHFISPGTVSRWKNFDLDGYYYDEQSGTVTTPSAITVTAIAKDGKKSSKTIRPKNANDSRNHSGGLRVRSEECQLQIESTGKYTDAIRRIEFG